MGMAKSGMATMNIWCKQSVPWQLPCPCCMRELQNGHLASATDTIGACSHLLVLTIFHRSHVVPHSET